VAVMAAAANARQRNAARLIDVFMKVPFPRGVTEGSMLPGWAVA
jgi:hypothetical protein